MKRKEAEAPLQAADDGTAQGATTAPAKRALLGGGKDDARSGPLATLAAQRTAHLLALLQSRHAVETFHTVTLRGGDGQEQQQLDAELVIGLFTDVAQAELVAWVRETGAAHPPAGG